MHEQLTSAEGAVGDAGPAALLGQLHALADGLQAADWDALPEADVLASWRELDRARDRLATVEHALLAQARDRGLAYSRGARDLAAFTRLLLGVTAAEARARVAAAEAAGPRRALAGEPLEASYPAVAAAQAAGAMSPAKARVVVATVQRLPDAVAAEHDRSVEAFLVGQAGGLDGDQFVRAARRIADTLDPDGLLHDTAHRVRARDLRLTVRPDGSGRLEAELTAECAERLHVTLDCLAAPTPAADGARDPRTAGQRRHDGLLDALTTLHRSGALPSTAGVATTVVLTMTADAWASGQGLARTSHGTVVPAAEAVRWAGGDYRLMAVVVDSAHAVVAHSPTRRLFTETQRLAIAARDHGCSFPGCDVRPAWCQTHHVLDHAKGGPTTVANGTLLCGHHHRHFQQLGWTCSMREGRPEWTPPAWLDPARTPRHNRAYEQPGKPGWPHLPVDHG
jgi:hypothetical protein